MLADEGLVRAEHGRGYRTLARSITPGAGSRLAILLPRMSEELFADAIGGEKAGALQRVALENGWQVLFMMAGQLSQQGMTESLREAEAWGAVLLWDSAETYAAARDVGLACVALDSAEQSLAIDYVLQDNFGGALQAGEHLLGRGHRRIAWFGPMRESRHSLERFAGAGAAFTRAGLDFPRELVFAPEKDAADAARRMLSRADRPTAVLALWEGLALAVARAARDLGLVLGKDLDLVGWATEQSYRGRVEREFREGPAPAWVLWDSGEMARIAVARLAWHHRDPGLKPLRISVPTRLALAGQGN
jgi:DNA-binding LacI/PurR family transcriptional regulator